MILTALLLLAQLETETIDSPQTAAEFCEAYASVRLPSFTGGPAPDGMTHEHECLDVMYGYGRGRDERKAIRCCIATGQCNRYAAMAFANGWGVKRNFDTAAHLLCSAEREMAPVEFWSMLDHLQRMKSGEIKEDLDYCRHLTSGRGAAFCARREFARVVPDLEKRLTVVRDASCHPERSEGSPLSAGDPPSSASRLRMTCASLFDAVRAAGQAFIEAEADRIADDSRGGTLYSSYYIGAGTAETIAFVELVERWTRGRAQTATEEGRAAAESALAAALDERLKLAAAEERCDECVRHVRDAQQRWIALRDTFAGLYAARWKGTADEESLRREIITQMTRERRDTLFSPELTP